VSDELYSTAQAAAILGISEATVKRLAEQGSYLQGRKVGSRWVFMQAQLDAFVPPPRGRRPKNTEQQ
jgi:excisionase family DNA binding protein